MADYAGFGIAEGFDRAAEKIIENTPKTPENFNRVVALSAGRLLALSVKAAINYNACDPIRVDRADADTKSLP